MFGYLIVLFTVVPAVELMVLIRIGSHIGAANTVLLIIATGILGAHLARIQGLIAVQKIQENLARGAMPSDELFNGMMILVGGILLLTPGFITDALGFALLIPVTRRLITSLVKKKIAQMMSSGTTWVAGGTPRPQFHDYEDADFRE